MRCRFYIRIPKIEGISNADLGSNKLFVQVVDDANGETTKTKERDPGDLKFDSETLCFQPQKLEGTFNFLLKSKTVSGENVLSSVKIPAPAIPIDKKVKIKVEMTRVMVSSQPWMTVVLHIDTRGKQPFDCSKGKFDRSLAPDINIESKRSSKPHGNSSSSEPPDYIPEFNEDIGDDDAGEILPPSFSSQHGGQNYNTANASFQGDGISSNPGPQPKFRMPSSVTFANPDDSTSQTFPMRGDQFNDPSAGPHSNPIGQYSSMPHLHQINGLPGPSLPTGGFPPGMPGAPGLPTGPMPGAPGLPTGPMGPGLQFAPMGLPPAEGRSPKAFYSGPAQPRGYMSMPHRMPEQSTNASAPTSTPKFNNPYNNKNAPQMPVGDSPNPLEPNKAANLQNQIQTNLSRQMAYLDPKNQQTYNLGYGPGQGYNPQMQGQPGMMPGAGGYDQQVYQQQLAQQQYQQQLAAAGYAQGQYPNQLNYAQYQSALYQNYGQGQPQYGYQSPSPYASQPYPHYPR